MANFIPTLLTTLANEASAVAAINANLEAISTALATKLNKDGMLPNQMEADLDMDSNDLLNVGLLQADRLSGPVIEYEPMVVQEMTTTTYTLVEGDSFKHFVSYLSDPISVVIPSGVLPKGHWAVFSQKGTGTITLSGTGIVAPTTFAPTTREQHTALSIVCINDAGTAYTLTGDLAYE